MKKLAIASLAAAAAFSASALAQSPEIADLDVRVAETDVSLRLLQSVLGDWSGTRLVPVLGDFFRVLNSGALLMGVLLTVYIVGVGILRSGESGELLGKGWSKMFLPVRLVVGNVALAPMASGYSMVQIAVLWLATQGIGLANSGWNAAVAGFVSKQGEIVASHLADRAEVAKLMRGIALAEACRADILALEASRVLRSAEEPMPEIEPRIYTTATKFSVAWGDSRPGSLYGPAACGQIEVDRAQPAPQTTLENISSFFQDKWLGEQLTTIKTAVQAAQSQAIVDVATRQMRRPMEALVYIRYVGSTYRDNPAAAQAAYTRFERASTPEALAEALRGGVDYWIARTGVHAQAAVAGLTSGMTTAFVTDARQTGWIGAGSWYFLMARLNSELAEVAKGVPDFVPGVGRQKGGAVVPEQLLQQIDDSFSAAAAASARVEVQQISGTAGGVWGAVSGASNRMTQSAVQRAGEFIGINPDSPVHSIVQLKNTGDTLLSAAVAGFVGKQALDAAQISPAGIVGKLATAGSTSTGPIGLIKRFLAESAGAATGFAGSILTFAVVALTVFAAFLAYWLPFMPLILWVGGILSWLIAVVEMVVAAPLWAVANIHPEGEGMASRYGANGYMIIVEVFARPILMIAGVLLAMAITDPFMRLVGGMFYNALNSINVGNITGFISIVAFVMIYVAMCVALLQRTFALIHIIPNSVLRWIGAHSNSFDQSAQTAQDLTTNVMAYFRGGQNAAARAGTAAGVASIGSRLAGQVAKAAENGARGPGSKNAES